MHFHVMVLLIILSSVKAAERSLSGKELLTLFAVYTLCYQYICIFSCFPFRLSGQDLGSDCTRC